MTTILYDGKTLACDSRRSRGSTYNDGALKVIVIEGDLFYKEQKVLAVAAAGNVEFSDTLIDRFTDAPDEFEKLYHEVYRSGVQDRRRQSTMLVVTDKGAYTFNTGMMNAGLVDTGGMLTSLGSGGREAYALVYLFNVPLHLAVAAAGIVGKHTASGGTVTQIFFDKTGITGQKAYVYSHTDEINEELRKHMQSTQYNSSNVKSKNLLAAVRKVKSKPAQPTTPKAAAPAKKTTKKKVTK